MNAHCIANCLLDGDETAKQFIKRKARHEDEFVTTHTKTLADGRVIDVLNLIKITKSRTPKRIATSSLKAPTRSKRSGFSDKKYKASDIRFPLLVTSVGEIVDGRHRYFKAIEHGVRTILAVVASEEDIKRSQIK